MSTRITFLDGEEDWARINLKLKKMEERALNTYPAMQRIAIDMMRVTGIQFRSQGRRAGGSWAQLREKTIVRKGNNQILMTRGSRPGYSKIGPGYQNANTLFNSLVFRGAPFQILHIENRSIDYGTDRPGARTHQEGSSKVPARPFLVFLPEDHMRWDEIIAKHIIKPFSEFTLGSPQTGYFGSVYG